MYGKTHMDAFDRPTIHAMPCTAATRRAVSWPSFRAMTADVDEAVSRRAYDDVPLHAPESEYRFAAVYAKQTSRPHRGRTSRPPSQTPTYERRQGGDEGDVSQDPLFPTLG